MGVVAVRYNFPRFYHRTILQIHQLSWPMIVKHRNRYQVSVLFPALYRVQYKVPIHDYCSYISLRVATSYCCFLTAVRRVVQIS